MAKVPVAALNVPVPELACIKKQLSSQPIPKKKKKKEIRFSQLEFASAKLSYDKPRPAN
jgi:hypothetical protein